MAEAFAVTRRPVGMCALPAPSRSIYILFDDGAVFAMSDAGGGWTEYPAIPGTEHAAKQSANTARKEP